MENRFKNMRCGSNAAGKTEDSEHGREKDQIGDKLTGLGKL